MSRKSKTFVTTARVDMKTIAEIVLFMESKGIIFKFRNQIIERAMYAFASLIPEPKVKTLDYAIKILTERGLYDSKPNRNMKTFLNELSLEDLELEGDNKTVLSEGEEEKAERLLEEAGL